MPTFHEVLTYSPTTKKVNPIFLMTSTNVHINFTDSKNKVIDTVYFFSRKENLPDKFVQTHQDPNDITKLMLWIWNVAFDDSSLQVRSNRSKGLVFFRYYVKKRKVVKYGIYSSEMGLIWAHTVRATDSIGGMFNPHIVTYAYADLKFGFDAVVSEISFFETDEEKIRRRSSISRIFDIEDENQPFFVGQTAPLVFQPVLGQMSENIEPTIEVIPGKLSVSFENVRENMSETLTLVSSVDDITEIYHAETTEHYSDTMAKMSWLWNKIMDDPGIILDSMTQSRGLVFYQWYCRSKNIVGYGIYSSMLGLVWSKSHTMTDPFIRKRFPSHVTSYGLEVQGVGDVVEISEVAFFEDRQAKDLRKSDTFSLFELDGVFGFKKEVVVEQSVDPMVDQLSGTLDKIRAMQQNLSDELNKLIDMSDDLAQRLQELREEK